MEENNKENTGEERGKDKKKNTFNSKVKILKKLKDIAKESLNKKSVLIEKLFIFKTQIYKSLDK